MATSEIRTKFIGEQTFTITLAGLGSSTAGVGRQSTLVSNSSNYPAAIVSIKVTSHATSAPTVGTTCAVYLLRSAGTVKEDNAGATDNALTVENATFLGSIVFTATANKAFYGVFDTSSVGPLGTTWGIAVVNSSGQSLHVTAGNHAAYYNYYVPEAQ